MQYISNMYFKYLYYKYFTTLIISQKHFKMQLMASANSFRWGPVKLSRP